MKYLISMIFITVVGCTHICPPQDCMIMVDTPDGYKSVVIEKGFFNDPTNFLTEDDVKELFYKTGGI